MRETAVALSYSGKEPAPLIVASGKDSLARKMLEIARENKIHVVHDPLLADILTEAEIGSYIPQETWEAVAVIFAFFERGINDGLL